MITASRKRKENIAEYLLYMWQIEDIIRANDLDIDKIRKNIIDKMDLDEKTATEMTGWYESLIDMMRREGVEKNGHLQINKNIIGDLANLNNEVLKDPRFSDYSHEFYNTLPFIVELRAKAGDSKTGEIETCFNALYGILMLRLQHKEISESTLTAIKQISRFIALLALYHRLDEQDRLFGDNSPILHPEKKD